MITVPALKPELFKSLEVDFGTTIAMSLWQRLSRQLNFLNAAMPIGMVMYFYDSTTFAGGAPVPDPTSNNWQFCDGSIITNPNSPMVGQNVPDFRGQFLKSSASIVGTTGGTTSINLTHNHGGNTSDNSDTTGESLTNDGFDEPQGNLHHHSISAALSTFNVMPQHVFLQPYMRIA